MTIATEMRTCRVCGQSVPADETGRVSNGYSLFRCSGCATVLVESEPQPVEIERAYNHLFEKGAYARHRREFEMLKSGILPRAFYRKRLLGRIEERIDARCLVEIGGGTGSFGVLARSRGWKYTDYDISEVAVDFARQLSLDARRFSASAVPPLVPCSADVVVMWEVIEHVWNVHDYLRVIGESLRPGGAFLFSTPNYMQRNYQSLLDEGFPSSPPIHLNFFTEESLRNSLRASGYFETPAIFKRRVYRPDPTIHEVLRSLRTALFLEHPRTLYGIAYRNQAAVVREPAGESIASPDLVGEPVD